MSDDWRKKYKGTNTSGQKILGVFGPDTANDICIVYEKEDGEILTSYAKSDLVPIGPTKVEAWVVIDMYGRHKVYFDNYFHVTSYPGERIVHLTGEYKE